MKRKISKVLFVGSKRLGLRILKQMHRLSPNTLLGAVTIDDRGDSRSVYDDFQRFSSDNRIALYVVSGRKDAERQIADLKPDICIVSGWYWLISKSVLDVIPFGFIGVHPSLLPRYRGSAPVVWAIINDEKQTGFSLFSFSEGMDDGDIWIQRTIPISSTDHIGEVLDKIELAVETAISEKYHAILDGKLTPTKQAESALSYCAARSPQDGEISWKQPAKSIYDFIRAQSSPYPGAFSWFNGEKLTIWRARLFAHPYCGIPGQIAQIIEGQACVICGDQRALLLEEIEWRGTRGASSICIKSTKYRFSESRELSIPN